MGNGLSCTLTNGVATSGTCSIVVNYGTSVTLSELAALGGNAFVSWSGGCSGTGTTCPMGAITSTPATTIASFVKTFTVTVNGAGTGTGTVTASGISCTSTGGTMTGTCSTTVNYGTSLTLTPSWVNGQVFIGWSGGGCVGNLKCIITITGTTSTTASFGAVGQITWDPNWSVAGAAYSNGFLSVSGNSAGTKNVRTTLGRGSGKWYWEITATSGNPSIDAGGLGFVDETFLNNASYVGATTNSTGFGYGSDVYWSNWPGGSINGQPAGGITPGPGSSIATGIVYMFAADMNTDRMWIGQNGTWYNSGNPATGVNSTMTGLGASTVLHPAATFYASSGNALTANFGGSLFANQVPAGFNPGFYGNLGTAGYPAQFSQTGAFSPDFLLGEPITVSQACILLRFGLITTNAGSPSVKMGLYTDNAGNPNTLVSQFPATPLNNGILEVPVAPVNLAPGTYWLMADYSVSATVDTDGPPNTGPNQYKYTSLPFANALPATFPAPSTQPAAPHFNYYLVVAQ